MYTVVLNIDPSIIEPIVCLLVFLIAIVGIYYLVNLSSNLSAMPYEPSKPALPPPSWFTYTETTTKPARIKRSKPKRNRRKK